MEGVAGWQLIELFEMRFLFSPMESPSVVQESRNEICIAGKSNKRFESFVYNVTERTIRVSRVQPKIRLVTLRMPTVLACGGLIVTGTLIDYCVVEYQKDHTFRKGLAIKID